MKLKHKIKNLAIILKAFNTFVNNIILGYLVFSALEISFSSKNKSKVGYTKCNTKIIENS